MTAVLLGGVLLGCVPVTAQQTISVVTYSEISITPASETRINFDHNGVIREISRFPAEDDSVSAVYSVEAHSEDTGTFALEGSWSVSGNTQGRVMVESSSASSVLHVSGENQAGAFDFQIRLADCAWVRPGLDGDDSAPLMALLSDGHGAWEFEVPSLSRKVHFSFDRSGRLIEFAAGRPEAVPRSVSITAETTTIVLQDANLSDSTGRYVARHDVSGEPIRSSLAVATANYFILRQLLPGEQMILMPFIFGGIADCQ